MEKIRVRPVFKICNDDVFKEIFYRVPNALAALLSDALNIDYFILKDNIKVERSEQNKGNVSNKSTICDFVVKIEDSYKINIEINTSKYIGLNERNFLFVSRLFSNMIPKGTKYQSFVNYKAVQLNINKFSNINDKIISKIMLTDLDTNAPFISSIVLYNFDIVKSSNMYYNNIESNTKIYDKLIRWGALLNTENIEDISNIIGDDLMEKEDKEQFVEIVNELKGNYVNFTKEQLEQHEEFKLEGMRLTALEEGFSQGYEEGVEQGLEQGIEQGIEQGVEQGIEQGMEQKNKEIVTNMLKENMGIDLISKITGLSKEEITNIKEKM